ncbi:MoaF-related domain-containing protein [Flavobacterium sp. HNIBRBA15423]|uniref:MoaF-related domain-containing protein n=1 Tax=Flavobacterium sp. HNIBRBA15423 TaxID=3458683 RepID=UPI004043A763
MKKAIFTIIILTTIISCKNQNNAKNIETTQQEKTPDLEIDSLSGKTLEYNYGDNMYVVNFKSEKELHWKCIKGDEKGKEAIETYLTLRLDNHTLFISWVENDGLGVSQVINLKNNTVKTFLKIDREIIPLTATIREL